MVTLYLARYATTIPGDAGFRCFSRDSLAVVIRPG
jgi:hypothetical protein